MKQSAFLAIGAVSLGLAGLGVLEPVVSAADAADTTVTANVAEVFGVKASASVNIGELAGSGDKKDSADAGVTASNNSGTVAHLTVNTKGADNNMVYVNDDQTPDATKDIPASATVVAGTPGWGIKGGLDSVDGHDTYRVVPNNTGSLPLGDINGVVDHHVPVVYGASNSIDVRAGNYQVEIVYSLTKDAAGTNTGDN